MKKILNSVFLLDIVISLRTQLFLSVSKEKKKIVKLEMTENSADGLQDVILMSIKIYLIAKSPTLVKPTLNSVLLFVITHLLRTPSNVKFNIVNSNLMNLSVIKLKNAKSKENVLRKICSNFLNVVLQLYAMKIVLRTKRNALSILLWNVSGDIN